MGFKDLLDTCQQVAKGQKENAKAKKNKSSR
jgi:hypothetical protein